MGRRWFDSAYFCIQRCWRLKHNDKLTDLDQLVGWFSFFELNCDSFQQHIHTFLANSAHKHKWTTRFNKSNRYGIIWWFDDAFTLAKGSNHACVAISFWAKNRDLSCYCCSIYYMPHKRILCIQSVFFNDYLG